MNARWFVLIGLIYASSGTPYDEWDVERCACTDVVNEVCGNNDVTYANLCELDCAAASTPGLTLEYVGACEFDYGLCNCPDVWDPVCGNNGLTYSSACDLRCVARFFDEDLHPVYRGNCPPNLEPEEPDEAVEEDHAAGLPCSAYSAPDKLCNSTLCEEEEDAPLCGNDGVTYKNYCSFCCAYSESPDFKIVQKGECNFTINEETSTTEIGETEKNDRKLKRI